MKSLKFVIIVSAALALSSCGLVQKARVNIFGSPLEDDCRSPNAIYGKETLVVRENGSRVVVYETPHTSRTMYLEIDNETKRTLLIFPLDDDESLQGSEFPD